MEVCGAATEVGFKAVEIGFDSIGCPGFGVEAYLDLVGLLIVLVRPHVVGEGSRECVVRKLLDPIGNGGIAKDGERYFEGKHGFNDGAELGTVRGIATCEVFVAGKDAVGQAVIFVQCRELRGEGGAIGRRVGNSIPDG